MFQIELFTTMEDVFGRPLETNSRPVQDLGNRRPVYVPRDGEAHQDVPR